MIYFTILLPVLLWVLFLAYSALLAHWAELRIEVKAVGILVVLAGLVIDIAFNWTAGLALGITPDLTFSQKCGRLKYGPTGWRRSVAWYCCANWLDPFQNGGHCR
jgi:hypothetical protein